MIQLHVITRRHKWAILKTGAKRAREVCSDKGETIQRAIQISNWETTTGMKTPIIVHFPDGSVDFELYKDKE